MADKVKFSHSFSKRCLALILYEKQKKRCFYCKGKDSRGKGKVIDELVEYIIKASKK